ncbi:MAG: BBP7 family outer membrane beta-barrel protein [Rubripirellula sp.]
MSVRKLASSLIAALALLGGAVTVSAQHPVHLADPLEFDPDFDWFEPVYDLDLEDMKPKKRAPTGWFATYDRLNLYGSRPELDSTAGPISETKIDSGWGHRYEVGYMLPDDDTGWLFNWTTLGVGKFFTQRQERLNRYIDPATGFPVIAPPFGVAVRQEEDNNVGYNFRFYDVNKTENVYKYRSYELNKTWRLEPYHYGGILEPLVGIQYKMIQDINSFQDYVNSDMNPPFAGPNFIFGEQITTVQARTDNEMFGGQLGFRYFKYKRRYMLTSDFRAFFGGNWQCSRSQIVTDQTFYDGNTVGSNVVRMFHDATDPVYSRNEEFYVGYDVRAELGYQLTKMFSVRAGVQVIHVARGVWRGGDGSVIAAGDNDQDLFMWGGTFGINLNH